MTKDRKAELAIMCRLEIRRAVTLAQMSLADYGYYLALAVFDSDFQSMLDRLEDKPFTEHDIPILMELVMEELWPRLREQHRDLRNVLFGKLPAKYPGVFFEGAEFAFDTGWRPLLQSAAERLQTYPTSWSAQIVGGKEKLGCCVIQIDYDGNQPGARSEIERLREEIRLRSLAACEICGGQGRLRLGSYAKTVCDKHAGIFEGLREDDGQWADPWKWHEDAAEPLRETAVGQRIDDDTWTKRGREQELLIEFNGAIEDVVNGAAIKPEHLDDYINNEIDGWRTTSAVPLPERDREFLYGYLRALIDEEYDRIRQKQAAERNTE